jgi:hypothetical protein
MPSSVVGSLTLAVVAHLFVAIYHTVAAQICRINMVEPYCRAVAKSFHFLGLLLYGDEDFLIFEDFGLKGYRRNLGIS